MKLLYYENFYALEEDDSFTEDQLEEGLFVMQFVLPY